jgi:site-specific recombinase XerD
MGEFIMSRCERIRKIPEILTDDEREALIRQPNPRYPTGLRNIALLRVMLDLGLRNAEARGIKIKNINLNSGRVKVLGKGRKERVLYLADTSLDVVRSWLDKRVELPGTNGLLFCTLQGGTLSERYVQQMVKRYIKKAGIDKDIHPHSLRHTFATDLYRESKNLRLTQKALGHSNISTTTIYTHIVDSELESAMKGLRR